MDILGSMDMDMDMFGCMDMFDHLYECLEATMTTFGTFTLLWKQIILRVNRNIQTIFIFIYFELFNTTLFSAESLKVN